MRGLSDASGVDYDLLLRVHMLPELVKVAPMVFLLPLPSSSSLSLSSYPHSFPSQFFLPFLLILRPLSFPPHSVKAGCSMLGAWGQATSSSSATIQVYMTPRLLHASLSLVIIIFVPFQLRALDWDVGGPLQNAPTVVIYHPDSGHTFANVGWSGWVASISGDH